MKKSYIWSVPTRVFHWLFVLFVLLALLTDDEDRLLNYHVIVGYGILILLVFRGFWGLFGPKYSLFKDFPVSLQKAKDFITADAIRNELKNMKIELLDTPSGTLWEKA